MFREDKQRGGVHCTVLMEEVKVIHEQWQTQKSSMQPGDNNEKAETIAECNLGKSGLQVKEDEAKLKSRRPLN